LDSDKNMRTPILDSTAPVAPYIAGENPYLLRSESSEAGRSILDIATPASDSYIKVLNTGVAILQTPAQLSATLGIDLIGTFSTIRLSGAANPSLAFYLSGNTAVSLPTSGTLATVAQLADLQPLDAELSAIAGLTSAADKLPYFTGSGTASLATFTAAGRTLVGLATSSALVTLAGTSPSIVGTNLLQVGAPLSTPSYMKVRHNLDNEVSYLTPAQVLSDIGAQPLDSDLTSLAGASATDAIYYRNSPGKWQTVTPGTALRFASGILNAAPWLIITGNYAASSGEKIQAYTGLGAFTITLPPSPSPGDWVLIEDAFGTERQWGDGTPLTVARNGSKINGVSADWVADESDVNRGPKLSCVYIDSNIGWCVK
jgi:hypothetical protein